ncbi:MULTISPECIES: hypothetical protein [unclassified Burkholderia]|uniref:hypothetical protein n=1 Tax=unclassified Burkholderia TaxID=2613784 RepID=UPI00117C260E|nr:MULTISPECIES: hypothetical protein [unclassified Burkholderia]MDN7431165.1 hypothetical protein [Burkholderia sp. AU45388]
MDCSTIVHGNEASPCLVYSPFRRATTRQTRFAFGIATRRVQVMAVRPFCYAARTLEKCADICTPKNKRTTHIRRFVPADVSRPCIVPEDFD